MIQKNIRRYKIIEKHMELVKKGKYDVARSLLHLLKDGTVSFGCTDVGWEAEEFLDRIGCNVRYGRGFNTAHYSL